MALVLNEPTSNRLSALSLATSAFTTGCPLVRCTHACLRVHRAHACSISPVPSGPAFRTSSFHSMLSRLEHRESIEKRVSDRSLVNYTPSKVERLYSRIVRDRSNANERTSIRSILATIAAFSIPLMYSNALYTTCKLYTSRVS